MKAKVVATSNKRTSQDIKKKRGTQALAKKKQQKTKQKKETCKPQHYSKG